MTQAFLRNRPVKIIRKRDNKRFVLPSHFAGTGNCRVLLLWEAYQIKLESVLVAMAMRHAHHPWVFGHAFSN